MPVLRGDRLIGRVDPRLDRRSRVFRIGAIAAESGAPGEAGPAVADALGRLASWLGANLDVSGDVPGA